MRLSATSETIRREFLAALNARIYEMAAHRCQLCGGDDFDILSEKDSYGLPFKTGLCRDCGMLQTTETMSACDYGHFYSAIYRRLYGDIRGPMVTFKSRWARGQRFLNLGKTHIPHFTGRKIVEIGCGSGGNLAPFAAEGHSVVGYDLDEDFLRYGRSKGFDLRYSALSNIPVGEKYDVVVISHFLEHLTDARAALRKIRELLLPDGHVIVEVPGLFTIGLKRCGWNFLRTLHPAHVIHFSSYLLSRLFQEEGFDEVYADETVRAVFRKRQSRILPEPRHNQYGRVIAFLQKSEQKQHIYWLLAKCFSLYVFVRRSAAALLRHATL